MNRNITITLSVYPNTRGFGFVVMEGPRLLVNYATCTIKPVSNEGCLARLKKIVNYHQPTVVLLRDADEATANRSQRIAKLIVAINEYIRQKHIPVHRYSRAQIKNAFSQFGTTTKHGIAQKIASEYDELKDYAPKPRKAWMDEDYNMGIFDAMALIGTHHFLTD